MTTKERLIRDLAYQIWESEGRPEGRTKEHWEMARRLLESAKKGDLQPAPKKARSTRSKTKPSVDLPSESETQLRKPPLLGKPAGADKPVAEADSAKRKLGLVSGKSKRT